MKFRVFYAPQVFRTWEKLFVLTSDGKLYCQYLDRFVTSTIEKSGFDYSQFVASDYSWGKGVVGEKTLRGEAHGAAANYQSCKTELSLKDLQELKPSQRLAGYSSHNIEKQIRWIPGYLQSIGLSLQDWDGELYNSKAA